MLILRPSFITSGTQKYLLASDVTAISARYKEKKKLTLVLLVVQGVCSFLVQNSFEDMIGTSKSRKIRTVMIFSR